MKFRDYQIEGIKQLKERKKALLTNECNTGKTLLSLGLAKELGVKTLVVCLAKKVIDWKKEGKLINFEDYDVVNYNNVHKMAKNDYDLILIDESHKMGGWNTLKGKAIIYLIKKAEYAVFISATPIGAKATTVYWPLKLCGYWKNSLEEFRIQFCGAYRMPGKAWMVDSRVITNKEKLKELVDSAKVHTSKSNRKVHVDKTYIKFDIGLPKFKKLNNHKKLNTPDFEETSTMRKEMGLVKLKCFDSYIKKNKLQPKAVFFTHHREVGLSLAEKLKCPIILGGTPEKKAEKYLADFSKADKGYLIMSLKSGGTGLNVFHCDTCYFLEQDFSPAQIDQAFQRLSRETLTPRIKAYFFVIENEHTELITDLRNEGHVYIRG